jgi:hypothetical protein
MVVGLRAMVVVVLLAGSAVATEFSVGRQVPIKELHE